jgi:hypothetical protein
MASAGSVGIGLLIGAAAGFAGREAVIRIQQQQTVQASEWRSKLDEIASLQQRIGLVQDELDKAHKDLQTTAAEKDVLTEQVADLSRVEQSSREAAAKRAEEMESAQSELRASLKEASTKVATLQAAADKATKDLEACASERTRAANELKTARADADKRLAALQQQIAESTAELERARERLAGIGPFESALELLGQTPKTGIAYWGEPGPGGVIDGRFEPCDAEGKPVELASALPEGGQFARAKGFVNVLGDYPAHRLVGAGWDVPAALGALPPGCVVKIEEVNDSIWGDQTWVRFSMP